MERLTSEDIRMLIRFRHDLHMHPELSGKEFRTTRKIREFLSALPGIRFFSLPVETGVAAQIKRIEAYQAN